MPDESIDGSNLEQGTENPIIQPASQEPAITQAQTASVQPEPPINPQPPQIDIPEQYRNLAQNMTPDQLAHELWKKDSALGRYRSEVSNLRTRQAYPPSPVYGQQSQPPLPGYEGQRPTGQQPNLNELYFERPADVLEQIVEKKVNAGIQSYEQMQFQRQQQAQIQRQQTIQFIGSDELRNIKFEFDNFTPEHEALMIALDTNDPETNAMIHNSNLTEQQVREGVRKLYAKADKILSGQLQDPEKIRALNIAQKQAAANGAPGSRASTAGTQEDREQEQARTHLKDRGWGHLLT